MPTAPPSITGDSATDGGAVGIYDGGLEMHGSTISGNSATYKGGGIFVSAGSKAYVHYSTISGNFIPPISGPYVYSVGGGGAWIRGSSIIENSTVAYNYAFTGGGGIRFYGGIPAKVFSSTIAGNSTCCYDGGNGILSSPGSATVGQAIIANNLNRGGYDDIAGTFKIYSS